MVAAGERAREPVSAGLERFRVVGCDRAERREADRAEQLHGHVDDPRREPAVALGRVGHAEREQRQERRSGTEAE